MAEVSHPFRKGGGKDGAPGIVVMRADGRDGWAIRQRVDASVNGVRQGVFEGDGEEGMSEFGGVVRVPEEGVVGIGAD